MKTKTVKNAKCAFETDVQFILASPIGPLHLVASEKGLVGIFWEKQISSVVKSLSGSRPELKILSRTVKQLEEYFRGKRERFDLPYDVRGTDFQKSVWNQLSKIPYGETCSYADIAKKIRNDKAVRAVGTANGRNPLSIIVPCHRVIASNGTLAGYAGGLPTKTKLLELEKKTKSR